MEPLRRDSVFAFYGLSGRPSGQVRSAHAIQNMMLAAAVQLSYSKDSKAFSNSITLHDRPFKLLCSCLVGAHLDGKLQKSWFRSAGQFPASKTLSLKTSTSGSSMSLVCSSDFGLGVLGFG